MILKKTPFKFMTPSEIADELQPVAGISVPSPISWADEERDVTAWVGNELQVAALDKLYQLSDKVKRCNDPDMNRDWEYLQASDHFYYMATKFFSDGAVHAYFNPYETPYDAFMNYMNVLGDFEIRVNRCLPDTYEQIEISRLDNLLHEKDRIIEKQTEEINTLSRKKISAEIESDLPDSASRKSAEDLVQMLRTNSAPKTGSRAKAGERESPAKTGARKSPAKTGARKSPAKAGDLKDTAKVAKRKPAGEKTVKATGRTRKKTD
jgi:alpha-amylase